MTASEVAAYAYCAKAWHLENVVGRQPDTHAGERRALGVAHHEANGARVQRLQRVGRPLLLTALSSQLASARRCGGPDRTPLSMESLVEGPVGLQGILLIAAAFAILGGIIAVVLVWLASRGTGFRPVLRGGVRVVGSDTGAGHSVLLTDPILGLRGRPDFLLEEKNGRESVLVPVEVKPTRRSSRL